jgi:hypothetical protein
LPCQGSELHIALHGERRTLAIAARAGDPVRLNFRHSIYESAVEEEFAVTAEGLRLVRLRYAEMRAAEFYGHEDARREGDAWVVDAPPVIHPSIVLRVSRGSRMRLMTPATTVDLVEWVGGDESARVVLSAGAR